MRRLDGTHLRDLHLCAGHADTQTNGIRCFADEVGGAAPVFDDLNWRHGEAAAEVNGFTDAGGEHAISGQLPIEAFEISDDPQR